MARRETRGAGAPHRRVGNDRRPKRHDYRSRAAAGAFRRHQHPGPFHEIRAGRPYRLLRDGEPGRRPAHPRLHSRRGVSDDRDIRERRAFRRRPLSAPSTRAANRGFHDHRRGPRSCSLGILARQTGFHHASAGDHDPRGAGLAAGRLQRAHGSSRDRPASLGCWLGPSTI